MTTEDVVYWFEFITPEQKAALATLANHLESHGLLVPTCDDHLTLLRFLRARQWNLEKTIKMYEAMRHWRQTEKLDDWIHSFVLTERAEVRKCYPHFYHKTDKWGRPVYIELLGQVDVDRLLEVTTVERFLKYHIQLCETFRTEKLPAVSAMFGRNILTTTIIVDMKGFAMSKFNMAAKSFLQLVAKVDQDFFPEHLGCMFIINVPLMFRAVWAFVRQFLDERTLMKIQVLGTDYAAELLKVIPRENLPQQFGGSSVCDPNQDEGPWTNWRGHEAASPTANSSGSGDVSAHAHVVVRRSLGGSVMAEGEAGTQDGHAAGPSAVKDGPAKKQHGLSLAGLAPTTSSEGLEWHDARSGRVSIESDYHTCSAGPSRLHSVASGDFDQHAISLAQAAARAGHPHASSSKRRGQAGGPKGAWSCLSCFSSPRSAVRTSDTYEVVAACES